MNSINKFMKSLRRNVTPRRGGLQDFYGAIVQHQDDGGPSYAETKRDFDQVYRNNNRARLF